jgi:hypothetical protein
MAIGTAANFKIYNEYVHSGLVETLTQASALFNTASRGAIKLTSVNRRGDFDYESLFGDTANLVTRRINVGSGSLSTVTDLSLAQKEIIGVKLNRKIGPVANTIDSFKKINHGPFDENALDFAIGVQAAKAMQVEQLNTALKAARAALVNQPNNLFTVGSSGTLNTQGLVSGLGKYGDAAERISVWVMHSKAYYDLVAGQIAANIDGLSNFNVATGTPVTLNRPVIITDSPALMVTSGSPAVTDYFTLGLTANAIEVEDSESTTVVREIVTGLENLVVRMQGEYAYNLKLKGFTWDASNGGANPTDTAIGTASNWDPVMNSFKDFAGVVIKSR